MFIFKNELPLDHEPSLDYMAEDRAKCDIEDGETSSWDHAYESAWFLIEDELRFFENLEWTES